MEKDKEKTPELLQMFFNNSEELYSIFDKDLNYVDVNDAFLRTFHFQKKDIIGKNLAAVSPDVKKTGRYAMYEEVIRTGEPRQIDAVTLHPSLGKIHVRIKAFKVHDGLGAVMQNITDLRNAIEELDTLSYRSSHELRAPVLGILGLVNLAANDVKNHEAASQYFSMIGEKAGDLERLLRQIRDTLRIRNDHMTIHLIQFNTLVDHVIRSLLPEVGPAPVRIEQDILVNEKFYCDRFLLSLLLENLVDNAIKYRKDDAADSHVKISIRDSDTGIRLTVVDNGIGIPNKLQDQVFRMFFRATHKSTGAGLGLYAVKHAVKKLGGEISLESREGEGTTVTVQVTNQSKDAGPIR